MKKKEIREWTKKEFEKIHDFIKNKEKLSHYDFLRIRNFKANNFTYENEEHIEKVTQQAFILAKEDKIKEAVIKLLELNGVAVPMASVILAIKFPDKYAIIDVNVLTALNKDDWLKGNKYMKDPQIYEEYLMLIRKKAKDKGVRLRDYERVLFEGDELKAEAKKGEIKLRKK